MAHPVIWSRRANQDLATLAEYLANETPAYADAVVRKILSVERQLQGYPFSGRAVQEARKPTVREVFAHGYRIIPRVTADSVTIPTVIHGRRHLAAEDL